LSVEYLIALLSPNLSPLTLLTDKFCYFHTSANCRRPHLTLTLNPSLQLNIVFSVRLKFTGGLIKILEELQYFRNCKIRRSVAWLSRAGSELDLAECEQLGHGTLHAIRRPGGLEIGGQLSSQWTKNSGDVLASYWI